MHKHPKNKEMQNTAMSKPESTAFSSPSEQQTVYELDKTESLYVVQTASFKAITSLWQQMCTIRCELIMLTLQFDD